MDLEVKMGRIHPVVVSDRAELFSLGDLLSLPNLNPVEVRVKGIGELQLSVFDPCMADDHDVPPGCMDIPCQHDKTVSNGIHRLAKAPFAAAVGDEPVLPEMAACTEAAGFVIAIAVRRSHGQVKSFSRPGNALGKSRASAGCQKERGKVGEGSNDPEAKHGKENLGKERWACNPAVKQAP